MHKYFCIPRSLLSTKILWFAFSDHYMLYSNDVLGTCIGAVAHLVRHLHRDETQYVVVHHVHDRNMLVLSSNVPRQLPETNTTTLGSACD